MDIHRYYSDGSGRGHDPGTTIEAINLKPWRGMIERLASDLFNGRLKPTDLHRGLIDRTRKELEGSADDGFTKSFAKNPIVPKVKRNLYRFSVAKTYHQLVEMQSFLVDDKGKLRSFKDFKKEVDRVHQNYNGNYLEAEHQTAKRSAQAARHWAEFEEDKDLFPNLRYRTVGDGRVREEHQKLEGIIKPLDDVFWDKYYPPNGFRCRCSVQATAEAVTPGTPKVKVEKGFENNVGKTGMVFDEKGHPYFSMDRSGQKAYKKWLSNNEE